MASNIDDAVKRLQSFIRSHISGQCMIVSQGDGCFCPLCDVSRLACTCVDLRAENERLRAFVADQLCDCYDDYNNKRPEMCDRCKLLGRE